MGGTWDLFRYPGIRSDSDMHTLGFEFKPWTHPKSIADGGTILEYLKETAAENGIDQHIRYGTKVLGGKLVDGRRRWTIELENVATGERSQITADFLIGCTATTATTRASRPSSRAAIGSRDRSSTRSTGRRIWTTQASAW